MLGVVCPLDAPGVLRAMTPRRRLMYRALPLAPYAAPFLGLLGPAGVARLIGAFASRTSGARPRLAR